MRQHGDNNQLELLNFVLTYSARIDGSSYLQTKVAKEKWADKLIFVNGGLYNVVINLKLNLKPPLTCVCDVIDNLINQLA